MHYTICDLVRKQFFTTVTWIKIELILKFKTIKRYRKLKEVTVSWFWQIIIKPLLTNCLIFSNDSWCDTSRMSEDLSCKLLSLIAHISWLWSIRSALRYAVVTEPWLTSDFHRGSLSDPYIGSLWTSGTPLRSLLPRTRVPYVVEVSVEQKHLQQPVRGNHNMAILLLSSCWIIHPHDKIILNGMEVCLLGCWQSQTFCRA